MANGKRGDAWDHGPDSGCLTYFITGRAGHCVMLPVWRWIGALVADLWRH